MNDWAAVLRTCLSEYEKPTKSMVDLAENTQLAEFFEGLTATQRLTAIYMNLTLATLHLRILAKGYHTEGMPDIPDENTFDAVRECGSPSRALNEAGLRDGLTSKYRLPLQLATLFSPVLLLSGIRLQNSPIRRDTMLVVLFSVTY